MIRSRKRADQQPYCKAPDLILTPIIAGRKGTSVVRRGSCSGACTSAERKAAQAELARLKAAVAKGKASESELDYNYTDCLAFGLKEKGRSRLGNIPVAILEGHKAGPHDIPNRFFLIATIRCGRIFLSKPFGTTYSNRWKFGDLRLRTSAQNNEITVRVPKGVVYEVTFPLSGCAAPKQEVYHVDDL